MKLVECVPNFSEGRDQAKIEEIAHAIQSVKDVVLLDVDPGRDTHRTVMTFAGPPEAAEEAAFRAIAKAAQVIDMSLHRGAHPRIGAADVCPFVPVSGMNMEECAELARHLGKRVGRELEIPVYLYEEAASRPERKNLADIRAGEYEGLREKLKQPQWKPDFGPVRFNPKSGAVVIGARKFLIAYNINLNTRDARIAREIALTIREKGRFERDEKENILRGSDGQPIRIPGKFEAVKAVGWYMDAFGRAQVSVNLTDHRKTPVHVVFDECCRLADQLGARVTGSELVGLIPLDAMLDAGRFFLNKQGKTAGVTESERVYIAAMSLGLSDLSPFDPEKKIIEYRLRMENTYSTMPLGDFVDLLSSEAPTPGGGSTAALSGAFGCALISMVAALTHGKKGYESVFEELERAGIEAQQLKKEFLDDVIRDAAAFDKVVQAMKLPKKTEEELKKRAEALELANLEATRIPLEVLRRSLEATGLVKAVVDKGNRNSLSDAGVAALLIRTAAAGAFMNILTNLPGIQDKPYKKKTFAEAESVRSQTTHRLDTLIRAVENELSEKRN